MKLKEIGDSPGRAGLAGAWARVAAGCRQQGLLGGLIFRSAQARAISSYRRRSLNLVGTKREPSYPQLLDTVTPHAIQAPPRLISLAGAKPIAWRDRLVL